MEPIEAMVQRAATTLIRLYETRSEMVLKFDDAETIRDCVQSAAWMGMPAGQFRRMVLEHSQAILSRKEVEVDADWRALDSFFQHIIEIQPR
jgi:hypothetical protein